MFFYKKVNIKIDTVGYLGRMGRSVVSEFRSYENIEISDGITRPNSEKIDLDISLASNMEFKLETEVTAKSLSQGYNVEIWEMHHNLKKDLPSGTAKALGKAAAKGLNTDLRINHYFNSHSNLRKKGSVDFAISHGGEIIVDHKIMFINDDEQVKISHRGINRSIYAKSAIRAALWLAHKLTGFYSMRNVLEI